MADPHVPHPCCAPACPAVRARQAAAGGVPRSIEGRPSSAACCAARSGAGRCVPARPAWAWYVWPLITAPSRLQVALAERFSERWAAAGQRAAAYAMHPGWTETDGVRRLGAGGA